MSPVRPALLVSVFTHFASVKRFSFVIWDASAATILLISDQRHTSILGEKEKDREKQEKERDREREREREKA